MEGGNGGGEGRGKRESGEKIRVSMIQVRGARESHQALGVRRRLLECEPYWCAWPSGQPMEGKRDELFGIDG